MDGAWAHHYFLAVGMNGVQLGKELGFTMQEGR
jgi:hypothetical protein